MDERDERKKKGGKGGCPFSERKEDRKAGRLKKKRRGERGTTIAAV